MKIDIDSEDVPWNGYLWKNQTKLLQDALNVFLDNPNDYDTGYAEGINFTMNALLHALKSDWRIKVLEKKAEEL